VTAAPSLDETIGHLMRLPKAGAGIGLHRMRWLLAPLLEGPFGARLNAMRVTGSNGKGSVSRLAAGIAMRLGCSTGLYTSPHLFRFQERIVVDDEPIGDDALRAAIDWLSDRQARYRAEHPDDGFGAFEAFTGLAMHHFAARRPDALVLEAGIGGRYDSVRAVSGTVVALTSIDYEHTDILGATLEQIAYDKADLCPDGGTLVVGALDAEVMRRLDAYAALRRITLIRYEDVGRIRAVRASADGGMQADLTLGDIELDGVSFALAGRHQAVNALVAAGLVREWLAATGRQVEPARFAEAFRAVVGAVRWPGRLQRIADDPPVFIDVGHTPDAIATTLQALPLIAGGRPVLLVTGVSYNKDADGIVSALLGAADEVVCTRAHHRGSDPSRIVAIVRRERPDLPRHEVPTIEQAMVLALDRARAAGMAVLVAGGLFLSIEAAEALRGGDPRALRFF